MLGLCKQWWKWAGAKHKWHNDALRPCWGNHVSFIILWESGSVPISWASPPLPSNSLWSNGKDKLPPSSNDWFHFCVATFLYMTGPKALQTLFFFSRCLQHRRGAVRLISLLRPQSRPQTPHRHQESAYLKRPSKRDTSIPRWYKWTNALYRTNKRKRKK